MRGERVFLLFVIGLFLIGTISAVCTVTFDKTDYVATETVTAAMTCSAPQERNIAYSVNWTNSSGALIHQDNGTTPGTIGQLFYEYYVLPSNYLGAINATLSGAGLEGVDTANVTAPGAVGNENVLVITNHSFGGGYIGRVGSIQGTVKDENGRKISGGRCMISGWSNDETQMILKKETFIVDGDVKVSAIMPADRFAEGTQYAYKILCYCRSAVSGTECIDELGNQINSSIGSAKGSLKTKTWLTVNTIVNKDSYEMKEELFICANVTNVNYTKRIPMNIYHQVRCSAGNNQDYDTDRALIIDDKHDEYDLRGISTNTTQMQCKKFILPELNYLEGRTSQCYASTNVWVLNDVHEEIFGYATTSPTFNITSDTINLNPDWQLLTSTKMNSIVNLSSSSFNDYNGTGTGNIDLQLHSGFNEVDVIHAIDLFNLIANVTVQNLTSNLTRHIDYELEFTEDDNIEIELRNVDLSKSSGIGWWNITIDFYDFENRQTSALEGISNKTGTFHLAVDCPATVDKGNTMNCSISAMVEDSQVVEKEVDFTCYVTDGVTEYSSLNFNQMINRSLITLSREFLVPSSFIDGTQYVLQCHADYYNLGSRRDSFYDTFVTSGSATISSSSSGRSGDGGFAPITGGAVDEGEEIFGERDIPFIPDNKNEIILLLIFSLIIGATVFILLKKKIIYYRDLRLPHFKMLIGTVILIGLLLLVGNYFYGLVNNLVSYSFGQDPLFRSILFIAFIVGMIIVLVKMLNIRMSIKLGEDMEIKRFHQDRKSAKLQHKINREILRHELAQAKKIGKK